MHKYHSTEIFMLNKWQDSGRYCQQILTPIGKYDNKQQQKGNSEIVRRVALGLFPAMETLECQMALKHSIQWWFHLRI